MRKGGGDRSIVRASLGAMSTRQDVDALLTFLRRCYVVEEASEGTWCNSARSTLCTPTEDESEQPRPPPPPPPPPAAPLLPQYPPPAVAAAAAAPDVKPFHDVRELPRPRKSSWRAALSHRPLPSLSRFASTRVR